MAKAVKTYLFCYDDHRNFSDEVRKQFSDTSRYTVLTFHNIDDLKNQLINEKADNRCKVVVLGLQDTKESFEIIDNFTDEIKEIDRSTGIILLGPPDKMDEIRKTIRSNIDSYVPRNTNQILRIHNTIKKLQSEHSLMIYRKRRNFSFYFLLISIAIAVLFAIIACFKLPIYF